MLAIAVAKSANNVVGSRGGLPWYLPADLRHFKQLTTGHTVVMGRKTFDSIISRLGHPLPERHSIVVTRDAEFAYDGVEVMYDVASIRKLAGRVFVIGGGEVYRQTIDYADTLYVTEVHADIEGDVTFPTIEPAIWRETSRETHTRDDKNQYDYDFVTYERQ